MESPSSRVKLACAGLAIALSLVAVSFEGVRASRTTAMSDDEASTILAARGILQTGLPRMPSGLIYYRSPMSHYLDALSMAVLGDDLLGWRGASLVAYGLVLLVPALLLVRRGQPVLGPVWVIAMGLAYSMQTTAISARMYMVYTMFGTFAVLAAVFWKPLRFDRRGWGYLALSLAAALSHQHFVVMIGGLLLFAAVTFAVDRPLSLARFLRTPLVVAPCAGFALVVALQFGENYFPSAWTNFSSSPSAMSTTRSFGYPLGVLAAYSPVRLWIFVAAALAWWVAQRRWRIAPEVVGLALVTFVAYLGISLLLPHQLFYYVSPIQPVFCFAFFCFALPGDAPMGWPPAVAAAALVVFAGGAALGSPLPHFGSPKAVRMMFHPPSDLGLRRWQLMRRFVDANDATVITSDPEVVAPRLGRISYHVRGLHVAAPTPCATVFDDEYPVPFAHDRCQMEAIERDATARAVPVLFMGSRLGTSIGTQNTGFIRTRFLAVGTFDALDVYCLGAACQGLASEYRELR